ncbi:fimbrial protein [Sodalis praecaptivus]|uniref:fimbrial protein n=1 Tax=Sodalis praecaptivus TaxID=1239307 RepID=UPI002800400F|nr:fimbrial protein [Sodalis praecaptivus]CAJ0990880.1 hypothetical protein NVIRENTERO_00127 [Sodalis praecaptivus]
MSIITRLIPLLILLAAAPLQATAAILTLPMPAITLNQAAQQQEGALLKTLVLPASAAEKLTTTRLSLTTPGALWNAGRGIYQTPVAGLGLSLCNRAGDRCLTQNTPWIPGDTLILRLYKTGNLQGGRYSLPALTLLAASQPVLRVMPPHITVTTALCRITAKRIQVAFPRIVMTPSLSEPLPALNFKIPVTCANADDYRNVLIQFLYAGRLFDDKTLQTQLSNIGIQIDNDDHQPVTFNSDKPLPSSTFVYRARLVRTAGAAQFGKFSVNATALMTFR